MGRPIYWEAWTNMQVIGVCIGVFLVVSIIIGGISWWLDQP